MKQMDLSVGSVKGSLLSVDPDQVLELSDEQLTTRMRELVNWKLETCKTLGFPIARYESCMNGEDKAYLELPGGERREVS